MKTTITSASNPKVKLVASLRERKHRERLQRVMLEGARLLRQALTFGAVVEFVLATPDAVGDPVIGELTASGADVFVVSDPVMRKAASAQTPQGLIGVARAAPEAAVDFSRASWMLVLDRIQDPGNVGALLRTAAAVGMCGVVATEGTADPKNPKALRASAGAYFAVPLTLNMRSDRVVEAARERGVSLLVADARASKNAYEVDWRRRIGLVVSNEGGGADPGFASAPRVSLPMVGAMESLNVAVAAGALMYEGLRQRRQFGR